MADFGGRYRLDRCLGAGGMGKVWLAYDEELADRPVAIKVMHTPADEAGLARFQREMRLASRMHHPNIMTVFTTGSDQGVPFMVMEYLQGRDLGKMRSGWSMSDVAQIGQQACRALCYAHSLDPGVVHRDINPGNLFICDAGAVKVTDFGLAKSITETGLSVAGAVYGTMPYISPEQWLGTPVTFSDDIWALGCVLYELLAGRLARPYATPADHVAAAARRESVAPLPDTVPAGLADVVMAMLHPDPRSRPTASQAVALLTAGRAPAAQRQPASALAPAPVEPAAQARELPEGQGRPEVPPAGMPVPVLPPPPAPQKTVTRSGKRRKLLIAAIVGTSVIGAATYGTISGFTGPSPGPGTSGAPPRVPASQPARAPGTAAAASVPSADPGAARKIAYQMMPSLGFNQATQYSCLVALWGKLSGWDVYAGNESGGYGIPQATPGDIMASAGPHWRTDAATQIKWGLGYIKETYGTPCGAWQYLKSHGSY